MAQGTLTLIFGQTASASVIGPKDVMLLGPFCAVDYQGPQ